MKRSMLAAGTIGVGILIGFGFYARQPKPQRVAASEAMADPMPPANDFQPVAPAAAKFEGTMGALRRVWRQR